MLPRLPGIFALSKVKYMAVPETIAIIGASGKVGRAIAAGLAGGAYRLLLVDKNEEELMKSLEVITPLHADADMAVCAEDACWEADIVMLAVPFEERQEVARFIRPVTTGKVVVSLADPLNGSGEGLVAGRDTGVEAELKKLLPYAKVVKVFNAGTSGYSGNPAVDGRRIACFIAGEDEEALKTVERIVRTAGFEPVRAGSPEAAQS